MLNGAPIEKPHVHAIVLEGKHVKETFWERTDLASSFELLGTGIVCLVSCIDLAPVGLCLKPVPKVFTFKRILFNALCILLEVFVVMRIFKCTRVTFHRCAA